MAQYSSSKIIDYLTNSDNANNEDEKGDIFEELTQYIFNKVPGVKFHSRNVFNRSGSSEIDLAFWNLKFSNGLYFIHNLILVECKNWTHRVGSSEVSWFKEKIRNRSLEDGILVTGNGITGSSEDVSNAHEIIIGALQDKIRILIVTRSEIESLKTTDDFIRILQAKYSELCLKRTVNTT